MTTQPELVCEWPLGCTRPPAAAPSGSGRRPKYCGIAGHTAAAAGELRRDRGKTSKAKAIATATEALENLPPEGRARQLIAHFLAVTPTVLDSYAAQAELLDEAVTELWKYSDERGVEKRIAQASSEVSAAIADREEHLLARNRAEKALKTAEDARVQADTRRLEAEAAADAAVKETRDVQKQAAADVAAAREAQSVAEQAQAEAERVAAAAEKDRLTARVEAKKADQEAASDKQAAQDAHDNVVAMTATLTAAEENRARAEQARDEARDAMVRAETLLANATKP